MPVPIGPPARVLAPPGQPVKVRPPATRRQTTAEGRIGVTEHFIVFGQPGNEAGQAVLGVAENDYAAIRNWFRGIEPLGLPFVVHLDPDAGGAYHFSCSSTDIYVAPITVYAPGFLASQVVEVHESSLNNGWDCGRMNGEVLSRALGFELHPEIAALFSETEQAWWAAGHKSYIMDIEANDLDMEAVGFGQLFLYYLRYQMQFAWDVIVAAGGQSLGKTYEKLTGQPPKNGVDQFITLLKTIETEGKLVLPPSGNPFPVGRR